jgi:thiol-disulfide isomerase/thioredoxin
MKKNFAGVVIAVCCLLTVVYASGRRGDAGAKAEARLLAVGDPAPDWTLKDAGGGAHSLSEYRGKVVVLDFWASWCGPCAKVMPRMEKLQRKYGGQGVVVFGVNSWETGDPVAAMSKKGCTYKLLLKGEEIAPAYGVTSLPVVCVIGADGRIIYCQAGAEHKDLADVIERHLSGRKT